MLESGPLVLEGLDVVSGDVLCHFDNERVELIGVCISLDVGVGVPELQLHLDGVRDGVDDEGPESSLVILPRILSFIKCG